MTFSIRRDSAVQTSNRSCAYGETPEFTICVNQKGYIGVLRTQSLYGGACAFQDSWLRQSLLASASTMVDYGYPVPVSKRSLDTFIARAASLAFELGR
jgi:hypothetical protein